MINIRKIVKDWINKMFLNSLNMSPRGLVEINRYFRLFGPIHFEFKKEESGVVAISKNFQYGTIIASAKDIKALDSKIKDAILTAFDLSSVYAAEAKIRREDELQYAIA
ncbi:MAG: hypothetical protein ABH884_01885 [Candidatus Komeilibacteria bacterium]